MECKYAGVSTVEKEKKKDIIKVVIQSAGYMSKARV